MKIKDILPQEEDPKHIRQRKKWKLERRTKTKGRPDSAIKLIGSNEPTAGNELTSGPYK